MRSLQPTGYLLGRPIQPELPPLLPAVAADCSPIYNILDDEHAPRHSRPQAPLGSDHSRHCGPFPGSPSRVRGQATWRSIVPIDAPPRAKTRRFEMRPTGRLVSAERIFGLYGTASFLFWNLIVQATLWAGKA